MCRSKQVRGPGGKWKMILRYQEDIFHLTKGNPGILKVQHPAQILSMARYKSSLQSSGAVRSPDDQPGRLLKQLLRHKAPSFQTSFRDKLSTWDAAGKGTQGLWLGHGNCWKPRLMSLPLALSAEFMNDPGTSVLHFLCRDRQSIVLLCPCCCCRTAVGNDYKTPHTQPAPECWQKLPLWTLFHRDSFLFLGLINLCGIIAESEMFLHGTLRKGGSYKSEPQDGMHSSHGKAPSPKLCPCFGLWSPWSLCCFEVTRCDSMYCCSCIIFSKDPSLRLLCLGSRLPK